MFLEKSLHIISFYEVGTYYRTECFFISFFPFDIFLFFTGICLCQLLFSALKPIFLLLKWKTNEPPEYEAYYSSSIPNNLTKGESTSISLLNVFSATDASNTDFSLANPLTNVPLTVGSSTTISATTVPSTIFHSPDNSTSD